MGEYYIATPHEDYVMHSSGPWKKHKYIKKVGNDYVYSEEDQKHLDEKSDEVMQGKYKNGEERHKALEKEGESYEAIQNNVNKRLGNDFRYDLDKTEESKSSDSKEKSENSDADNKKAKETEDLANSVIRGDYGNGEERKNKLKSKGYSYEEVQNKVNEMLGNSFRYNTSSSSSSSKSSKSSKSGSSGKSSKKSGSSSSKGSAKSDSKTSKKTEESKEKNTEKEETTEKKSGSETKKHTSKHSHNSGKSSRKVTGSSKVNTRNVDTNGILQWLYRFFG